jgi:hypothetical protein
MRKKSVERSSQKSIGIEEIAKRAQNGEDVSAYFTGKHVAKQRVSKCGLSPEKLLKNCCERRETQARGGEKPECTSGI